VLPLIALAPLISPLPPSDTYPAPSDAYPAAGRSLTDRVTVNNRVRQLITVTSARWHTTRAVLKAWTRPRGGSWHLVAGPFPARIGYSGWVRARVRVQSTGTTPAGTFTLPRAFGALADPGTTLPYIRFDDDDYWPYEPRDPATYNVYQHSKSPKTHWRPGYAEQLSTFLPDYDYAAVIGFNLPHHIWYSPTRGQRVARDRADTRRGGGIFLHVRDGGPTAGCVAIAEQNMRRVLSWLRADRRPRIVMGPRGFVASL
jgi:L,D-peptidoglycan transpeptidase YkuD (ErfK/YbiS/YcfS/YnhG family)